MQVLEATRKLIIIKLTALKNGNFIVNIVILNYYMKLFWKGHFNLSPTPWKNQDNLEVTQKIHPKIISSWKFQKTIVFDEFIFSTHFR